MNKQLSRYIAEYTHGFIDGWSKRCMENDNYFLLATLGVAKATDIILNSLLQQDLMKRYSYYYTVHEVRYIVESIVLNYVDEELSTIRAISEYC